MILNISALLYYKYTNFFIDQLNLFLDPKLSNLKIMLPVGISFFTFHKISYAVDVYRGISRPSRNIIEYLLYISFFPQLIAGPIIRFHDIENQLVKREASFQRVFDGLFRFSIGLAKKVLIADALGSVVDRVFRMQANTLTTEWAWFGILSYSFQIYFDFSGYSDMAIGLAKVFGFDFLENFNKPYNAQSVTDFWKRWHISLSRWMKDYLYIPLGGNRVSKLRNYFNLWIVFLASGFWHGASWNFIIWGIIHGSFIVFDRVGFENFSKKIPKFLNVLITFLIVMVAWVFFRAEDLNKSLLFIERMFVYTDCYALKKHVPKLLVVQNYNIFAFVFAAVVCFLPVFPLTEKIYQRLLTIYIKLENIHLKFLIMFILLFLSSITLATDSYKAFIYFRF